jgi:RAB protein geranylgeranyltransferase component A
MLADLLATCAIGDNEVIDSICCTIYGEKELINIISDKNISLYRKRPFMKLLVWVHMTVQGNEAAEKSTFYRNNR